MDPRRLERKSPSAQSTFQVPPSRFVVPGTRLPRERARSKSHRRGALDGLEFSPRRPDWLLRHIHAQRSLFSILSSHPIPTQLPPSTTGLSVHSFRRILFSINNLATCRRHSYPGSTVSPWTRIFKLRFLSRHQKSSVAHFQIYHIHLSQFSYSELKSNTHSLYAWIGSDILSLYVVFLDPFSDRFFCSNTGPRVFARPIRQDL